MMNKRILFLVLLMFFLTGCNNQQTTTLYTGQTTDSLTDQITAVDGREVELRVSDNVLQWRYVGDMTWNDLFNLDNLEGVGIASAIINDLGELVITYSDDTIDNLGEFNKLNLVQFVDALGNIISVQLVMDGDAAIEPTPPEIEGHYFAGWDKPFANITDNLIVYGYYIAEFYTITFDSQGGSDVGVWGYDYGVRVFLPVPEKLGYLFLGWYKGLDTNSEKIENGFLISEDMFLYAKWQKTTGITVNSEVELLSALADYSYQEIYFGSDITVKEKLVINGDRNITIYGNHHQLIAKDTLSLFSIISEFYYDYIDIQIPSFGNLWIYDLEIVSDNDIIGFETEQLFDLDGLNGYSLNLNNVSLSGEAEVAISLYDTQNVSVLLSDSLIDVEDNGIDIYDNEYVSVIVENSDIKALKPLSFVDTINSKMVVKDASIIAKTNEDTTEAFSVYNSGHNDIRFINTHFDNEGENLYYITQSLHEQSNQYLSFTDCVFNVNHPIFNDLFYSETYLTQHVFSNNTLIIKEGVTIIPDNGFNNVDNFSTIILPSTLEEIGNYAFYSCNNLNAIVIPEGVTSIGTEAFAGNFNLASASVPSTVTNMGADVFVDASQYLSIYVMAGADYATWTDGWNGLGLVNYWVAEVGKIGNVTYVALVDQYIRIIDYLSYEKEDVVLPDSLIINDDIYEIKQIMPYAFAFNNTLRSIVIPKTVYEITDTAFFSAHGLENIVFSADSDLMFISDYAFYDCIKLQGIIIPNTVAYLGYYAFANNIELEMVEFETGSLINQINEGTFNGDYRLKTIEIPASVTIIGDYAFNNNQSLTLVSFEEGSLLTTIGNHSFYSCMSLDNFFLPDSVTVIGEYAFGYAENMTNFIISDSSSLTTIGGSAFFYNSSLVDINLVDGINSIGIYAFAHNNSLTEITLPLGISYINNSLFYYCHNLERVNIPQNSNITEVRAYAFAANDSLRYINLPDTVTTIGIGAFLECYALEKMYIPSAVTNIDDYAFNKCESLTDVIFANVENLTHIGTYAFGNCYNLTRFFIPDSVILVEEYAFRYSVDTVIYVESTGEPGTWSINWHTDAQAPIFNASYIRCIQNNGGDPIMIYGVVGNPVSAPLPTIYEGYVFDDWYIDIITDYIVYEFTTMPDDPVTVYAEWDPLV